MKVYLSADMEGVAACAAKEEVDPSNSNEYPRMCQRMTAEVRAACEAALAAGAKEVWVKDAHWHGRNIDPAQLPAEGVRLIRGWSGHPYSMMQELNRDFSAVLFVGYHSRASSGGHPLSHTMSGRTFAEILVNGRPASEFLLNTYTAAREGVPVAFLSGDEALCAESRELVGGLVTVPTMHGVGDSVVALHPTEVIAKIRQGVGQALTSARRAPLPLPASFQVEVRYKAPAMAYRASFYPGARLSSDVTVAFEARDWLDVLRQIAFAR
jgi:D-amino peptidase